MRMKLMERDEGRRRVEEADERMRESQESKTEERTGQQRDEPKSTDVRAPQSNQDSEDIGCDIDVEKWEKFQKSKRSAEGGEE
eukprot:10415489-Karenia_brevis.AAC.1